MVVGVCCWDRGLLRLAMNLTAEDAPPVSPLRGGAVLPSSVLTCE